MKYRQIGRSGLRVSEVAIGGWLTFGGSVADAEVDLILRTAFDCGINFVDLADVYAAGRAEDVAGRTLRTLERSRLVIASKVFGRMSDDPNDAGLSRKHILESCDRSLRRIGCEYLDLYFCHREDPSVPLYETLAAMQHLIDRGKVLYWGTSCWTSEKLQDALRLAPEMGVAAPIVEQPRYSLLERSIEHELVPLARHAGLGLTVFSPLAGGVLTGKYTNGIPEGTRASSTAHVSEYLATGTQRAVRDFCAWAERAGHAPSALAIAWVLAHSEVACAITGATHRDHVLQNAAAHSIALGKDELTQLEQMFARSAAR